MLKAHAIEMLGGSQAAAAEAVGITPSAVSQWPEVLPSRISDRVLAAIARRTAGKNAQRAKPQRMVAKAG